MRFMAYDDSGGVLQGGTTAYYTAEKIGPKRSFTAEGYLLCLDVPLARTGEMIYGPGETPIKVGDSGYAIIERLEEDVFRPEFIASFEGKPVTNNHPKTRDGVHAGNWKQLAVGHTINPRRGEGIHADFIMADLLITDAQAIADVMEGKREVSAGYQAEYIPLSKGRGRQKDMLANHVALVEAGRCGDRCSIQDHRTHHTEDTAVRERKGFWKQVMDKLRPHVKDEAAASKAIDEAAEELGQDPQAELHLHAGSRDEEAHGRLDDLDEKVAAHDARHSAHDDMFEKLKKHTGYQDDAEVGAEEEELAEELAEEDGGTTGDAKYKGVKDSKVLANAFQSVVAGCEILVPGMSVKTFDEVSKPKATLASICSMRKNALDLAWATPEGKKVLQDIVGPKLSLDSMNCGAIRTLFGSAVAVKKAAAGASFHQDRGRQTQRGTQDRTRTSVRSVEDLNKRNREFYQGRGRQD